MSGTLTIHNGSKRVVKVISKSGNSEETFVIPNDDGYQLILNEDCEIRISNNTVNNTRSCQLQTDNNSNPNITMKVLKMSNSETDVNNRFVSNKWLKEFNHNVRDNWDNVTDMGYMFYGCNNLTNVTLPNALPNVSNMSSVFQNCSSLTSITLPDELPNVINIEQMFSYCKNLTSITLPSELPSVTHIDNMFYSCNSLRSITLPNELPNVTYMSSMFSYCKNLTSITLPNELPNVINMYGVFRGCSNLTSITLPNTLPSVINISQMFNSCISFNGNLSNTKFKSNVEKGTGTTAYDYYTPLWLAVNKPRFVL